MGLIDPQHVGSQFPEPGIELGSPALESRSLTTGPPGMSLVIMILKQKSPLFAAGLAKGVILLTLICSFIPHVFTEN